MAGSLPLAFLASGLPPGRTGIETDGPDHPYARRRMRQDYPPAGLGLRLHDIHRYLYHGSSGLPSGRTGIETYGRFHRKSPFPRQDYPPAGLAPDPDRFVPYKLVRRIPWVPTI